MIFFPQSRFLAGLMVALIASIGFAARGVAEPALGAEKEDQLADANSDGKANPGETVKYTVRVASSGGDATKLSIKDVLDGRTALNGKVKSKPLALPDAFSTLGNLRIQISAASGLLANDVDAENIISVDGARQFPGRGANFGLTATAETKATAAGGSVMIMATGSFTYEPPPGFTGADTFTYNMVDPDMNADSGTATISVNGPMTWFVDAVAAPGGNGSQAAPYDSLVAYNAANTGGVGAPGVGDLIFIASAASPYDGGIQLRPGQMLIGQGVSLAGFLMVPAGVTLPGAGAPPTIRNTSAAIGGRGIQLATNNRLSGLNIGDTPGGPGIFGDSFGTLTVDSSVSVTSNGTALDLSNGNFAAAFSSITVLNGGASSGVTVVGATGSLDLGACDITTTSGRGLWLQGSATFNCSSGTITTTTGTPVQVNNAVLGMTLTSVSCNGAGVGINLDTTTGSFTVTGDGAGGVRGGNGSGGILQNTTGDAIVLNNVTGVSLSHMTIGDPAASPGDAPDSTANIAGDGIQATDVGGLTLDRCTIARTGDHGLNGTRVSDLSATNCLVLNAGNAQEEHGFRLRELVGDNFVRESLFDAFNETGIELVNTIGTADLTFDNTTFQDNQTTVGNAGEEAILLIAQGSAQIVALVSGSTFDSLAHEAIQAISEGTGSDIQLTVEKSSFLEGDAGDGVIIFNPDGNGSGNITVNNSTFSDADAYGPFAVLLKNDSTGTLEATVTGNSVKKHALLSINHDDLGGTGLANGTTTVRVEKNTVSDASGIPIDVIASENPATGGGPDFQLTLLNNNVGAPPSNQFSFSPGIRITISDQTRARMRIEGNTAQGEDSITPGVIDTPGIRIDQLDAASVGIQGLVGDASAFLDELNISNLAADAVGTFIATPVAVALPAATTLPTP